jgi:hypothetical protein
VNIFIFVRKNFRKTFDSEVKKGFMKFNYKNAGKL